MTCDRLGLGVAVGCLVCVARVLAPLGCERWRPLMRDGSIGKPALSARRRLEFLAELPGRQSCRAGELPSGGCCSTWVLVVWFVAGTTWGVRALGQAVSQFAGLRGGCLVDLGEPSGEQR